MATGVTLLLIGVFLISRTATHDANGKNLVDRILGLDTGNTAAAGAPPTAAGATPMPHTARQVALAAPNFANPFASHGPAPGAPAGKKKLYGYQRLQADLGPLGPLLP